MFYHHNPLINIDHYNYYVRCVDRFKNLLQNQKCKLFIMTFVNGEHNSHSNTFLNNIIDFNNNFSNYTSNYILLVIIHYPNKQKNHHIFTYSNNIHFLELHTLSSCTGTEFANNNDNIYLDNIINSKYNFDIKH
jgi:hypothetical protein